MSNDSTIDERWMWLRFIPLKLHLVLGMLGAFVGQYVQEPDGTFVGFAIGAVVGIPLQIKKRRCVELAAKSPTAIQGMNEGLDLDRGRNLLQFIAGVLVAACGSVIGYNLPYEARGLAAGCGAIAGFIVGVFLGGVVLMFMHFGNEIRTKIRNGRNAS